MTLYEREAIAMYQQTGDLRESANAWLGEDGEDDIDQSVIRLKTLLS